MTEFYPLVLLLKYRRLLFFRRLLLFHRAAQGVLCDKNTGLSQGFTCFLRACSKCALYGQLLFKLNTITNLLIRGKPYHLRKCGE